MQNMKLAKQWTLMLAAGFVAWAGGIPATAYETETVDGVAWKYTVLNGKATISSGIFATSAIPASTSGMLSVPSELGGCPVVTIGESAFYGCSKLTGVTIPESVAVIGSNAFHYCIGLAGVSIPDGATKIMMGAFWGCQGLTELRIPDGVSHIGASAFCECSGLTNVVLSAGLTNLGSSAFASCGQLESITIPRSVTGLGTGVFRDCFRLGDILVEGGNPAYSSVGGVLFSQDKTRLLEYPAGRSGSYIVPDGVVEIGEGAFGDCGGLTAVALPGSLRVVGDAAFYQCVGLVGAVLPDGVESIGSSAFASCTSLSGVLLPDSVKTIGIGAFSKCGSLVFVSIPEGVETIESGTFSECSGLVGVSIPESVTAIENLAFFSCENLASIEIPDGVTSIGVQAFFGCIGLKSAIIGNGVTNIGDQAFLHCGELRELTMGDNVRTIGNNMGDVFVGCSNLHTVAIHDLAGWCRKGLAYHFPVSWSLYMDGIIVTNLVVPEGVTAIGNAFCLCTGLSSVTFPDSLKAIGNEAFRGCRMTEVTLPENVTSLSGLPGGASFRDCTRLKKITILGDASAHIGEYSPFAGCTNVDTVVFGERVRAIGTNLFHDCDWLERVAIPEGVERIEEAAFYGCDGLESVTIPASVTSIGNDAFRACNNLRAATILGNVTNDWDGYWGPFGAFSWCTNLQSVVLGDAVAKIGNYMFENCSNLESVTLPTGVTSIGSGAFSGCSGLKTAVILGNVTNELVRPGWTNLESVVLGEGMTMIADRLFAGCTRLEEVALPTTVVRIGSNSFAGCTGLADIRVADGNKQYASEDGVLFSKTKDILILCPQGKTGAYAIPAGVARIGQAAFSNCTGLVEVAMQDGVEEIGAGAFRGCTGLAEVSLPASVEVIGEYAFRGCSGLASVTLPQGLTTIGDGAFSLCTGLQELVISDSVQDVGRGAFSGCTALARLEVPGTWERNGWLNGADVPEGCEVVYRDTDGIDTLDGVEWRYGISRDGKAIVGSATPAEGVLSIPAQLDGLPVAGIGSYAFEECTGLTAVIIPDGVTWIANDAFRGCNGLQEVSIPSTVSEIAQNAFVDCTSLESVILPEGVESIGYEAFSGCTGLKEVSIPNSLTSIGNEAFEKCNGVRDGKTIPGIVLVDGWVVGYNAKTLPTRLDLSGVRGLADDALAWAGLRSVILSEGLPTIGGGAFHGCDSLEGVSIPDSVVRIGELAFSGCSALTDIEVGEGNRAFSSRDGALFDKAGKTLLCCPGGKGGTYAIPAGVEEIACGAFDGCRELAGLILPDSLENIDEGAFGGCWSLEALEAPASWKEKHFDYHGKNLFWTEYAEVPERCTVTYRDAPAQTETEDSPVPVPFAWLETEAADILAAAGGDHEAAALAPAANGLPVWQCYVAGLSTTEPEAEFKVKSISFADGEVQIRWSPDLNENGTLSNRTYTVEGKPAMTNEWGPRNPSSRFFRVRVELPPQ